MCNLLHRTLKIYQVETMQKFIKIHSLEYNRILAIGGSWMVKGDIIKSGNFDKVEACKKAKEHVVKISCDLNYRNKL